MMVPRTRGANGVSVSVKAMQHTAGGHCIPRGYMLPMKRQNWEVGETAQRLRALAAHAEIFASGVLLPAPTSQLTTVSNLVPGGSDVLFGSCRCLHSHGAHTYA